MDQGAMIIALLSTLCSSCIESTSITQSQLSTSFAGATSAVDLDGTRIQLSWPSVSGAQGYLIYQASGSTINPVLAPIARASSTATSYIDGGLTPYTRKSYVVQAVDSTGATDGNTTVVSATTFSGAGTAAFVTANTVVVGIGNSSGINSFASALHVYAQFAGTSGYTLLQIAAPASSIQGVTIPSGQVLQGIAVRMVDAVTGVEDGNTVLVVPTAPAITITSPVPSSAPYPTVLFGEGSNPTLVRDPTTAVPADTSGQVNLTGTCTYGNPLPPISISSTNNGTFVSSSCSQSGVLSASIRYPLGSTGLTTVTVSQSFNGILSTTSLTLNLKSCPTGFIAVPGSSLQGTNSNGYYQANFCISKYPMKNVSGIAVSEAATTPWDENYLEATASCSSLGTGYHLTTNAEWMTVAQNAESVGANWGADYWSMPAFYGTVGLGYMPTGNVLGCASPNSNTAESTDDDPYTGMTGVSPAPSYANWGIKLRRTMLLSNGELIWDFGWNGPQWVNIDGNNNTYYAPTLSDWISNTYISLVNAVLDTSPTTQITTTMIAPLYPAALAYHDYNSGIPKSSMVVGDGYLSSSDTYHWARGGGYNWAPYSCNGVGMYNIQTFDATTNSGNTNAFRCSLSP